VPGWTKLVIYFPFFKAPLPKSVGISFPGRLRTLAFFCNMKEVEICCALATVVDNISYVYAIVANTMFIIMVLGKRLHCCTLIS